MIPQVAELPWFVAVPVALLLLIGSGLTLVGAIGMLRLKTFYERLHAPTLGASYGMACILAASMIFFSVLQTRLVLHELAITVFILLTTPVTLMLVAQAALHRDRMEDSQSVPPALESPAAEEPRAPDAPAG